MIRAHTDVVEIENEGEKVHRHEIVIDEQNGDSVIQEKDVKVDKDGNIEVEESVPEVNHIVTE